VGQAIWEKIALWTLLLSGFVLPFRIQSEDNLDFLEKVENLQISPTRVPDSFQDSVEKPPLKKQDVSSPKPSSAESANSKPAKTTSKTRSSVGIKSAKPLSSSTSQQTTTAPALVSPPPPQKDPPPISDPVATREPQEERVETNHKVQVWIDENLEMEPDYLPGFRASVAVEKPEEVVKPEKQPRKSQALPQLEGRFSLWNSLVDFLSKYQKAFYIFGILVLFAIYRLKMGRSGGTRKSVPTIRKLRR